MKRTCFALLASLVIACSVINPNPGGPGPGPTPTPTIQPPAPQVAIFTAQVDPLAAIVTVGTRSWPTRPNGIVEEEFRAGETYDVTVSATGYVSVTQRVTMTPGRMAPMPFKLERVPVVGRTGPVRLSGHALADNDGEYLSFGITYFPALWMEKNDPERLEKNLEWAARGGAQYLRILSMVGGGSWEDRAINPNASDYWQVVDRLVERARRHGLRLQVTVFAAAQDVMPSMDARRQWVDLWAARVSREPEAFILVETANEAWQNGLDTDQLVELTRRLNERTSVLVAPSAPSCGSMPEGEPTDPQGRACVEEWRRLLEVSDLMTPHFDRDSSKADGPDRPVRQPWEMNFVANLRGYFNNEPIGPQSSVAEDNDPQRLALAAATTWLSIGASYTLHTGAGIRAGGAADLARGRSANLWEVPNLAATMFTIRKVREILPKNLPNCRPANAHWADAPLQPADVEQLVRAYQSVCPDGTFVALPHGIKGQSVAFTPRRPVEIDGVLIPAGGSYTVQAPSKVIVGRVR